MDNELPANIKKEIESIVKQIVEKYKPEKIILFSAAKSEFSEDRDLDFLIIKSDTPYLGRERAREQGGVLEETIKF